MRKNITNLSYMRTDAIWLNRQVREELLRIY